MFIAAVTVTCLIITKHARAGYDEVRLAIAVVTLRHTSVTLELVPEPPPAFAAFPAQSGKVFKSNIGTP